MLDTNSKRNYLFLAGIGIAVRLLVFFVFYSHITIFPDSSGYIELAERISTLNLSGYFGGRSPGYPLFLALLGGNLYLVVGLQALIGVCASLFWYKSFIKLNFGPRKSFLFSLFTSTLLDVIFFETAILVESLVLFLISIIISIIISGYFERKSFKEELMMGFLLGFLTLIKPFFAFLPFLFYMLFIFKNPNIRNWINLKLLIFMFPLFSYFGWSYINKINTGYFVSSTFFGLNIAQNCVRFAEKGPDSYQWIIDPYVEYREKSIEEGKPISMAIWYAYNSGAYSQYNMEFPELSHHLGLFGKETISANPWDYFQQVIKYSFVDFWKPRIHWNYEEFNFKYANKLFLLIWYLQYVVLLLFRITFLCLSLVTIYKGFRSWDINLKFILCTLVLSTAVLQAIVTYGSNERFSFPFEFIMIMVVLYSLKDYPRPKFLNRLT